MIKSPNRIKSSEKNRFRESPHSDRIWERHNVLRSEYHISSICAYFNRISVEQKVMWSWIVVKDTAGVHREDNCREPVCSPNLAFTIEVF
jgi:hypothetical protein